jgi:hypothetical protein
MNEEQQKILQNFINLEEELVDSEHKEDLSILREAWGVEISKPGCTQCIKNAALNKYRELCVNMIEHNLSIEQSKKIHDLRGELNKEHQEVQQRINEKILGEINSMKVEMPQPASPQTPPPAFNPFLT